MLARIRKSLPFQGSSKLLLLLFVVGALSSCATKEEPQLITDGRDGRESALPWNKQEKWENQGQLGSMAERFQGR